MTTIKLKSAGLAAGAAICLFIMSQGCGSDATQDAPPATGGAAGTGGGSAGSGGSSGTAGATAGSSGTAGSGTSGSSGTGGEAGATAGTAGTAGSTNCGNASQCYTCKPTNGQNDQFHNQCSASGCSCTDGSCAQSFDKTRITWPSTGKPALIPPTNPT